MKKILKFIIPIILLIGIVILFIIFNKNDKFKDLGYNDNQIKIINKLDNKDIILKYKYNDKIISIIKNNNFNEKNLEQYLDFSNNYNIDIDDIIYIVNNDFYDKKIQYDENIISIIKNKEFKKENLDKYLELNKKYKNVDNILFIINNNYYNNELEYTDDLVALMKEKYYIHSNLERYLKYKSNHELDNYNVVLNVNCNLDYKFYTNTTPTDLSKNELILVNKYYYLDKNYVPDNLVKIDSKHGVSQYLNKIR